MPNNPDLPAELWLAVFSNLDYETLSNSIPLVCRIFHALLERTSETSRFKLDKELFREYMEDGPARSSSKDELTEEEEDAIGNMNTERQTHPFLSKCLNVNYTPETTRNSKDNFRFEKHYSDKCISTLDSLFKSIVANKRSHETCELILNKRWKENITSPPIRRVMFYNGYKEKKRQTNYLTRSSYGCHGWRNVYLTSYKKPISFFDMIIAWVLGRYVTERMFEYFPSTNDTPLESPFFMGRFKDEKTTVYEIQYALWWFCLHASKLHISRKKFNTRIWPDIKSMMKQSGLVEKCVQGGAPRMMFH